MLENGKHCFDYLPRVKVFKCRKCGLCIYVAEKHKTLKDEINNYERMGVMVDCNERRILEIMEK